MGGNTRRNLTVNLLSLSKEVLQPGMQEGGFTGIKQKVILVGEKLDLMFGHAPEVYFLIDTRGNIIYANKAVEKLLGYRVEELTGRKVYELSLLHPSQNYRMLRHIVKSRRSGVSGQFALMSSCGREVITEITTFPVDIEGETLLLGTLRDITRWKTIERELKESSVRIEEELSFQKAYFQQLFEGSPQGIAIVDNQDRIIDINRGFQELFQYSPGEVKGRRINDVIVPWHLAEEASCISDTVISGQVIHRESVRRRKDGSLVHVSILGYPIIINGKQVGIFGIYSDITKRKQAEKALRESEERHRRLVEFLPDAICVHAGGKIILANKAASKLFGFNDPGNLAGRSIADLACPDYRDIMEKMIKQVEESRADVPVIEGRVLRTDGRVIDIEMSATFFPYKGKGAVLSVMRDITERKIAERTINYLAYHDTLTNLPNRMLFNERFALEIERARDNSQMIAVLFFDLDGFKNINDTMGHSAGDKLLKAVGNRLKGTVRRTDILCRMGGDEFILLLTQLSSIKDAANVAQKILKSFREPYIVENSEICITTSIGISIYPQDGEDPETLIRNADTAMYKAKEMGGNSYQFFTHSMELPVIERMKMQKDIRRALENGELEAYYQPRLDLKNGQVNGVEAHIRWNHPQLGGISPSRLIAVAEETGLIVDIGEWILYTACAQVKAWHNAGLPPVSAIVNISQRQLQQCNLLLTVQNVLDKTNLEPGYLELEIAEDTLCADLDLTTGILNQLREMGVRIAIDGFGTGYSSLSYLKRNQVDIIKINQCFIERLARESRGYHIVSSIISLARSLGIGVAAEGVENLEQLLLLKEMLCDYAQGYYISKPLPKGELENFIRTRAFMKDS